MVGYLYMKVLGIIVVLLILLGAAGFVGYRYLVPTPAAPSGSTQQTAMLTGRLMAGRGADYSYILLSPDGKTTGIASQKIDLGQFVNKNVTITGSYSGTTLYAYSVHEMK